MSTQLNITKRQYESLRSQGMTREEILDLGTGAPPKPTDFLDRTADIFDTIFGGGKIGEFLGTKIAERTVPKEQRQFVSPAPSGKEIAGDVLRTGALFTPVGRIAGAVSKFVSPVLKGLSKVTGLSAGGGVAGVGFDVGEALKEKEKPTFLATGVGIGLPPALKATGALIRGTGFLGSELLGVSTGAGGKSVQEFYKAIRQGGEAAKQATRGLRGKVSEDVVVQDAALALDKVVQARGREYVTKFKKIIDDKQTLDVSSIHKKVADMLKSFQVKPTTTGLDFSQSAIRFDQKAQGDIQNIVETMKAFGTKSGDRTPLGVDLLKQSLDDLFTESSKVRAFIAGVRDSSRKVLANVKGYDKIQGDYETKTRFIKEIRNTLSLKDGATIDTKLKKLLSSLRQQQGFRDELVRQLDDEAGTFITAQIAGQQLKELLPSGILRAFGLGAGIVGATTGVGIIPLLQAFLIMSPRLVGEVIKVLGFTARQSDDIMKALNQIAPKGARTPGDVLFNKK